MEKEQVQSLLRKFAANKHTAEELEALLTYFHENPQEDLSETFEQLLADHTDLPTEDVQLSDAISKRITQYVFPKTQPTKSFSIRRLLPYAAAILVLLSAAFIIYRYQQPSPPANILTSKYGGDVLPGGNRATLRFSNGNSVILSENKGGVIAGTEQYTYSDGEAVSTTVQDIEYATLTTPRGGQYKITLPDGTTVWLNAASSLRYPIVFNADERKVGLVGEGYFEVAHNEQHPFIVESKGQSVKVLGTSFNINAYADEPIEVTTLVEGSVEIVPSVRQATHVLKPGQQAVTDNGNIVLKNVEPTDFTSWKDGMVVLNEVSLAVVQRQVERWYDVEFAEKANQSAITLNGIMHRNTRLSGILELLELNTGRHYRIEGRRIMVQ